MQNSLAKDLKKDLTPLRRGFLIQASRYAVSGLVLLSLPFLTFARVQTLSFSFGIFDAQLVSSLVYLAVIVHGVLFTFLGFFILAGGLAYLKHAQKLIDTGVSKGVLLDLEFRKGKTSLNGGTILSGTLTYDDGSRETLNLTSNEKPDSLNALIAQSQRVELFGAPFSFPRPRVLLTQSGLLLEQPNELGLGGSIFELGSKFGFGFADKEQHLDKRIRGKAVALILMSLVYVFVFSPVSFNLALFSSGAKPIFSITILASVIYMLCDFIESIRLAASKKQMELVDCQFTILKKGFIKLFNPRHFETQIVFSDGREAQKGQFLFEGFNVLPEGKPQYGSAYVDSSGKVCGIVTGANALVRSTVSKWALAPLVIYLITLPACFTFMQPNKNESLVLKSGNDYYQQGLLYKAYGWTEKSRMSMLEAEKFGGETAHKAETYIKTHLPVKPISVAAEQLNVKGYNFMVRRHNEDAIETFKQCIKQYPEFEWPYANLGSIYVKSGEFTKAAYYLNQATKINPDYVNALSHLSDLELKQGHKKAAISYLKNAIKADPDQSFTLELKLLLVQTSI